MDIKKALEQAKQKTAASKARYLAKITSRPATPTGILQFMAENDCRPLINKKDKFKINGLIKFFRNNSLEDKEIYDFIKNCIGNWNSLQNIKIFTDNHKKYNLDSKPNIVDIIHCKAQLYGHFQEEIEEDEEEIDLLEAWGNRK